MQVICIMLYVPQNNFIKLSTLQNAVGPVSMVCYRSIGYLCTERGGALWKQ